MQNTIADIKRNDKTSAPYIHIYSPRYIIVYYNSSISTLNAELFVFGEGILRPPYEGDCVTILLVPSELSLLGLPYPLIESRTVSIPTT